MTTSDLYFLVICIGLDLIVLLVLRGFGFNFSRQTQVTMAQLAAIPNIRPTVRSELSAQAITAGVYLALTLPFLIILGVAGYYLGGFKGFLVAAQISLALGGLLILRFGAFVVPKSHVAVIERLGMLQDVLHSGFNVILLKGWIDRIILLQDMEYRRVMLFQHQEFEFSDGALTGGEIVAWLAFVSPDHKTRNDINGIDLDSISAAYAYANPLDRAREILEGRIRAAFEAKAYKIARAEAADLCQRIASDAVVQAELRDARFFLRGDDGIIVTGFTLSQEMRDAQLRAYQGEVDAERARNEAIGYEQAMRGLIRMFDGDVDKAAEFFTIQQNRGALERVGNNVSFIQPGMAAVINSLGSMSQT